MKKLARHLSLILSIPLLFSFVLPPLPVFALRGSIENKTPDKVAAGMEQSAEAWAARARAITEPGFQEDRVAALAGLWQELHRLPGRGKEHERVDQAVASEIPDALAGPVAVKLKRRDPKLLPDLLAHLVALPQSWNSSKPLDLLLAEQLAQASDERLGKIFLSEGSFSFLISGAWVNQWSISPLSPRSVIETLMEQAGYDREFALVSETVPLTRGEPVPWSPGQYSVVSQFTLSFVPRRFHPAPSEENLDRAGMEDLDPFARSLERTGDVLEDPETGQARVPGIRKLRWDESLYLPGRSSHDEGVFISDDGLVFFRIQGEGLLIQLTAADLGRLRIEERLKSDGLGRFLKVVVRGRTLFEWEEKPNHERGWDSSIRGIAYRFDKNRPDDEPELILWLDPRVSKIKPNRPWTQHFPASPVLEGAGRRPKNVWVTLHTESRLRWAGNLPVVKAVEGGLQPPALGLDLHAPGMDPMDLEPVLRLTLVTQNSNGAREFSIPWEQLRFLPGRYGPWSNDGRLRFPFPGELWDDLKKSGYLRYGFRYRLEGEGDRERSTFDLMPNERGVGLVLHLPDWLFGSALEVIHAKGWQDLGSLKDGSPEDQRMTEEFSRVLQAVSNYPVFWWPEEGSQSLESNNPRVRAFYRVSGNHKALGIVHMDPTMVEPGRRSDVWVDLSPLGLPEEELQKVNRALLQPNLNWPATGSSSWKLLKQPDESEQEQKGAFLHLQMASFHAVALEWEAPVSNEAAGMEQLQIVSPEPLGPSTAVDVWQDAWDIFPSTAERLKRVAVMSAPGGPQQFLRIAASLKSSALLLPRLLFHEQHQGKALIDHLPREGQESGYIGAAPSYVQLRIKEILGEHFKQEKFKVQARVHLVSGDVGIPMEPINIWRDGAMRFEGLVPAESLFLGDHFFEVEMLAHGRWHRLADRGWIRIEPPNPAQIASQASPEEMNLGLEDAKEELQLALQGAARLEKELKGAPETPETKEKWEAIRLAREEGIVTEWVIAPEQRTPLLRRLVEGGKMTPAQARGVFTAVQVAVGIQKGFFVGMQFKMLLLPDGQRVLIMYNANRAKIPKPPEAKEGEPPLPHPLSDRAFRVVIDGQIRVVPQRSQPGLGKDVANPLDMKINLFGYLPGHGTLRTRLQQPQEGWEEASRALINEMWEQRDRRTVIAGNIGAKAAASLPDWAHEHDVPWLTAMDDPGDGETRWIRLENGVRTGLLRNPYNTVFVLEGTFEQREQMRRQADRLIRKLRWAGFNTYNEWGTVTGEMGRLFIAPRNPVEPVAKETRAQRAKKQFVELPPQWQNVEEYRVVRMAEGQFRLMTQEELASSHQTPLGSEEVKTLIAAEEGLWPVKGVAGQYWMMDAKGLAASGQKILDDQNYTLMEVGAGTGRYRFVADLELDAMGMLVLERDEKKMSTTPAVEDTDWKPFDDYAKPLADQDYKVVEVAKGQYRLMGASELAETGLKPLLIHPVTGKPMSNDPFIEMGRPVIEIKMGLMEMRKIMLVSKLEIYEDPFLEARLIKAYPLAGVSWSHDRIRKIIESLHQPKWEFRQEAHREVVKTIASAWKIKDADGLIALIEKVSNTWRTRHVDAYSRLSEKAKGAFNRKVHALAREYLKKAPDKVRPAPGPRRPVPSPRAAKSRTFLAVTLNPPLDERILLVQNNGEKYLEIWAEAGGSPANVAGASAEIGRPTVVAGAFSGETGQLAAEALRKVGAQVLQIPLPKDYPPSRVNLMISSSRPGRRERRLVSEGEPVPASLVAELDKITQEVLAQGPCCIGVGERWTGPEADAVAQALGKWVGSHVEEGHSSYVASNLAWSQEAWFSMLSTHPELLTAPVGHLARYWGMQADLLRAVPDRIVQRVDRLRRSFGIKQVVAPLGAGGSLLATDPMTRKDGGQKTTVPGLWHVTASPVLVLTYLSGAIDTADAHHLFETDLGESPEQAALKGVVAATITMEERAHVPSPEEVEGNMFRAQLNVFPPVSGAQVPPSTRVFRVEGEKLSEADWDNLQKSLEERIRALAAGRESQGAVVVPARFARDPAIDQLLRMLPKEMAPSVIVWEESLDGYRRRTTLSNGVLLMTSNFAELADYVFAAFEGFERITVFGEEDLARLLRMQVGIPVNYQPAGLSMLLAGLGISRSVSEEVGISQLEADLLRFRGA